MSELADGHQTIAHGTSRSGRWLHARRVRITLWIAALEAIIVALFHDVSRWTVIGIAIIAVGLWLLGGRNTRHDTFRQLSWIFAASQLIAVIAVIFAFILFWTAIIAAGILAVIGLAYLWLDRR